MYKGGKFLKKLWCCIGGSVQDNLIWSTGLIMWIGHCIEIQKLVVRALVLRQSDSLQRSAKARNISFQISVVANWHHQPSWLNQIIWKFWCSSWLISWNSDLEMVVFVEGGKLEKQEKNSQSKVCRNQQQTHTTHIKWNWNWTHPERGGRKVLPPLHHPCSPNTWEH